MKVQQISDVHCEWQRDEGLAFCENLPVEGKVLVLPGDFATRHNLKRNIGILCKRFEFVIHVPGNHEYYASDRGVIHNKLDALEKDFPNFFSLRDKAVIIEGQRFIGSTLWWTSPDNPVVYLSIKQDLNDFDMIAGYKKWHARANHKAKEYLNGNIFPGDIVVTHHAPSWQSRNRNRRPNPLDFAYYNNLDDMILRTKPKLWIHGHTHDYTDYMIGETRVMSRPHGYSIQGIAFFNKHETIEI